jgi:hypothetical protein
MSRWLGLAGALGGALWIVRAATGDDWLVVYVVCVASFLGVVWALWKRSGAALGPFGNGALAAAAVGLALMLVGGAADADAPFYAGGFATVVALVVVGFVGSRRLEGAPQWLFALAAACFAALPALFFTFGLGFVFFGAAAALPEREALRLPSGEAA